MILKLADLVGMAGDGHQTMGAARARRAANAWLYRIMMMANAPQNIVQLRTVTRCYPAPISESAADSAASSMAQASEGHAPIAT